MKKILFHLVLIMTLSLTMNFVSGQVLDVRETIQEHSNWCWDASSNCVLNYYGYVFTQCEIADWTFSRSDCCGEPTFAWGHACNSGNYLYNHSDHDVDDILSHYGSLSSLGWERALTQVEVQAWILLGIPYVFRWDWDGGGAHALVGHGIIDNTVYYMDPWPGEGLSFGDYDWMVDGDSHEWTRSLNVLSAPSHYDYYVEEAEVVQSCVGPGAQIDVSCNQCYAGSELDANLVDVKVGYFLSENSSYEPSTDIYLGHDASGLGTDNRCDSETATLTIPGTTSAGNYYVLFVSDYEDQFPGETNNSNNIAAVQLRIDDVPPTLVCPSYAEIPSDAGQCTYTIVGTEFDATATDNGTVVSLSWVLSGATTGSGNNTMAGIALNFGINYITWTAIDECGNSSTCQHEIYLNKITTITEVTVNPTTQNYSDLVEFTATIQPGECTGVGQAATHVTFFVGAQPMGDPVLLTLDGDILMASATYPLLDLPGYEGTMDPDPLENPKEVTAVFSNVDPDFEVDNPTTDLTILPENACAIYAGVYYASTGSVNSDEATVVLAATIVEEDDGSPGDFFNTAFVQFLADERVVAEVPVIPVTEVNGELPVGEIGETAAIGAASYEWEGVSLGVYDIRVKLVGYYDNDPSGDCDGEAVVTVGKPSSDFISGGGYVFLENPMGLAAGDIGSKNNFGFNVKYNKKLTNLQGNISTIIRRTEGDGLHIYKAKGNVLSSLTVNDNEAVFTGKCSLQDITDPDYTLDVTEGGGATLQFTMTDNGEPGFEDLVSITVWKRDGGLWFTNLWDDEEYLPIEQTLDGGNLVVKSAKDDELAEKPPKEKSAVIAATGEYSLKVFPNPFSDEVRFEFVSPISSQAKIDIYDITGRMVQTIYEGFVKESTTYNAEFKPKSEVSGMFFYRMKLNDVTDNGKLIYKK
jgi:hypothetical protein